MTTIPDASLINLRALTGLAKIDCFSCNTVSGRSAYIGEDQISGDAQHIFRHFAENEICCVGDDAAAAQFRATEMRFEFGSPPRQLHFAFCRFLRHDPLCPLLAGRVPAGDILAVDEAFLGSAAVQGHLGVAIRLFR